MEQWIYAIPEGNKAYDGGRDNITVRQLVPVPNSYSHAGLIQAQSPLRDSF